MIGMLKPENKGACAKAGLLVTAALALSGCVRISFPPTGEIIRATRHSNPLHGFTNVFFRVVSVHPIFAVYYKEGISGPRQKSESRNVAPVLLSEGHYRNWRWVIRADPMVAVRWEKGQRLLEREARAEGGRLSPALLRWRTMLKQLYRVDAYLLGRTPMPVDLTLLLRAPGYYRFQGTIRSKRALPLRIVYMPDYCSKLSPAKCVSNNIGIVLYTFQSMLVAGEWKYGDLPKPPGRYSHLRQLKGDADTFAWTAAAEAAVLGGSSALPPTIRRVLYTPFRHLRAGGAVVHFLAHRYADALATGQALTSQLVRWDLGRYLRDRKLSLGWPGRVPALPRYADAIIDFSRVLTRYGGNVLKWTPPQERNRLRGFFPRPSSPRQP